MYCSSSNYFKKSVGLEWCIQHYPSDIPTYCCEFWDAFRTVFDGRLRIQTWGLLPPQYVTITQRFSFILIFIFWSYLNSWAPLASGRTWCIISSSSLFSSFLTSASRSLGSWPSAASAGKNSDTLRRLPSFSTRLLTASAEPPARSRKPPSRCLTTTASGRAEAGTIRESMMWRTPLVAPMSLTTISMSSSSLRRPSSCLVMVTASSCRLATRRLVPGTRRPEQRPLRRMWLRRMWEPQKPSPNSWLLVSGSSFYKNHEHLTKYLLNFKVQTTYGGDETENFSFATHKIGRHFYHFRFKQILRDFCLITTSDIVDPS